MPNISIIMSVFNGEKYLRSSVESMLSQVFRDFEFIIIDDGSTDETPSILNESSLKDPRIKLMRNQEKMGVSFSVNRGIESAQGKYVARFDCDDISMPERLQKQWDFMERHPKIGILGCSAYIINEFDNTTGMVRWPLSDFDIRRILIRAHPFFNSSVIIRKNILDEVGMYDTNFVPAEDYEMCVRISKVCEMANLEEPLIKYRLHSENISYVASRASKISFIRTQWKAVKDGLYGIESIYFIVKNIVILCLPDNLLRLVMRLYYRRIILPVK